MNIQREGRQKRQEAEEGLRSMEQELKSEAAGDSRIVIPLFCSLGDPIRKRAGNDNRQLKKTYSESGEMRSVFRSRIRELLKGWKNI